MRFNRAEFIEYLESLPRDEPFCKCNNCPIQQWKGSRLKEIGVYIHMVGELDFTNPLWVTLFIRKIDKIALNDDPIEGWSQVTPGECLGVLHEI